MNIHVFVAASLLVREISSYPVGIKRVNYRIALIVSSNEVIQGIVGFEVRHIMVITGAQKAVSLGDLPIILIEFENLKVLLVFIRF